MIDGLHCPLRELQTNRNTKRFLAKNADSVQPTLGASVNSNRADFEPDCKLPSWDSFRKLSENRLLSLIVTYCHQNRRYAYTHDHINVNLRSYDQRRLYIKEIDEEPAKKGSEPKIMRLSYDMVQNGKSPIGGQEGMMSPRRRDSLNHLRENEDAPKTIKLSGESRNHTMAAQVSRGLFLEEPTAPFKACRKDSQTGGAGLPTL
jgi:hypothetical protein